MLRQSILPGLIDWSPSQRFGFHKDHTTTADSGRRSNSQILNFKDGTHSVDKFDLFTTCKTQLLVIVQHCVHVLNPNRIDRTIEDNPLPGALRKLAHVAHSHSKNTISPFVSVWIISSVQLRESDRLWIEIHRLDIVKEPNTGQHDTGPSQNVQTRAFARVTFTNNHEAMPHHHSVIQLHNLLDERLVSLKLLLNTRFFDCLDELGLISGMTLDPREKVHGNTVEQGKVIRYKFGEVTVADGPQAKRLFWYFRRSKPQFTSSTQNGEQTAHPKIVVILRRQLFRAQL
mmetsp:Transcript_30720/g.59917  ORF Transcript_30720/g.59917 Transcript_30720/m.59917 type:complete len:287 (-) Transcript_30720:5402-6262(-)